MAAAVLLGPGRLWLEPVPEGAPSAAASLAGFGGQPPAAAPLRSVRALPSAARERAPSVGRPRTTGRPRQLARGEPEAACASSQPLVPWPAAAPASPDRLSLWLPRHAAAGPGRTAECCSSSAPASPLAAALRAFIPGVAPLLVHARRCCGRASRSLSFMSGKLALEPLRVCWARLGWSSFAPLGGWVGSCPSSSSVSVKPRSHAICALRRARVGTAPRHLPLLGALALALALAQLPHLRQTRRARHGREEQCIERDRFARCLLDPPRRRYASCGRASPSRARHCARLRVNTRARAHAPRDTCAGCKSRASARPVPHCILPLRVHAVLPKPDAAPRQVDGVRESDISVGILTLLSSNVCRVDGWLRAARVQSQSPRQASPTLGRRWRRVCHRAGQRARNSRACSEPSPRSRPSLSSSFII